MRDIKNVFTEVSEAYERHIKCRDLSPDLQERHKQLSFADQTIGATQVIGYLLGTVNEKDWQNFLNRGLAK